MLFEHQENHVKKIDVILDHHPSVLDASTTGCGKTYTTCYIAKKRKLRIFVIAPTTLHFIWEEAAEVFDVGIIKKITYQTLRGTSGKNISHNYLRRDGKEEYFATDWLLKLIRRGTLFVFDEVHAAKNITTSTFMACKEICRAVSENFHETKSRCILLSATHNDKKPQVKSVTGLLGLYNCPSMYVTIEGANPLLYKKLQRSIELTGYLQFVEKVKELEANNTLLEQISEIDMEEKLRRENVKKELLKIENDGTDREVEYDDDDEKKKEIYDLDFTPTDVSSLNKAVASIYEEKVKKILVTEMTKPPHYDRLYRVNHTFFETDRESTRKILLAVMDLLSALRPDETSDVKITNKNFGLVQKALVALQLSKVQLAVTVARKFLEDEPNCKVVIFGNFNDSLESIASQLSELKDEDGEDMGVILFTGKSTKIRDRSEKIKLFQEDSNRARVFVANTKIGGAGISLDDTIGTRPRKVILMPDFKFTDLIQALGRCCRTSTKSVNECHFLYCKGCENERLILENLYTKTCTLTDLTLENKSFILGYA